MSLAVHGVTPPEEEAESEDLVSRFASGRLGMLMESRRIVPTLREAAAFRWDVAPFPTIRSPASVLHTDGYCLTAGSPRIDGAWRFLEFALGPEGQRIMAETGRTVPSLVEVAASDAFLEPSQDPPSSEVYLDQLGPLTAEIAAALHSLHADGLVHLDVKPKNIIMGAPPRLIDLSIARTIERAAATDHPIGVVAVADTPRPEAANVIARLRGLGIQRIVMLTGDHQLVAETVAQGLGVEEVRADLLPQEKQQVVADLVRQEGQVAMVGDGVNDAPALASATVGIAMGGASTDVALETAVVLMGDDLSRLPLAIDLGRATRAVITQNLALSLAGCQCGAAAVAAGFSWFIPVPSIHAVVSTPADRRMHRSLPFSCDAGLPLQSVGSAAALNFSRSRRTFTRVTA